MSDPKAQSARQPRNQNEVGFENFDEKEDATVIERIVLLEVSLVKCILVVPILTLISGFFFLLLLYWLPILRYIFFYKKTTFERARHLGIFGKSKKNGVHSLQLK